jgi:CBS domain-containing protein
MNISQVMTRNPRVCSIKDSLEHAAQIMWENDCGCVPVVDGDGRTVGVITDRDICMAAYTQGAALWQMPVGLAASRSVVSVRENDPIETAQELMREHRIRRLPVVDGEGHPIGILSMNDVARRAQVGHCYNGLSGDTVARTLAAICTPRAMSPTRPSSAPGVP